MNKLYRVKDSKIDKKGLYAKKDIAPGTRIIQYIGKLNEIIYVNDNKFLEDNLDYIQTEKFILGIEKQSNNLDENQIKLLIEQRSKVEEDLTKIEKLLSNVSFLNKAPKEVIVKNENLKKQFLTKIKEINEIISN